MERLDLNNQGMKKNRQKISCNEEGHEKRNLEQKNLHNYMLIIIF